MARMRQRRMHRAFDLGPMPGSPTPPLHDDFCFQYDRAPLLRAYLRENLEAKTRVMDRVAFSFLHVPQPKGPNPTGDAA